jgi:putative FmdB family regulatory protein
MPTYEYKCPRCETVFDVVQKMKDKPAAKCPKCRAKAERQLSGGHGIHFKGTGFYETDYKRAGEKKPASEGGSGSASGSGTGSASGGGSGTGGASPSISPSKVSGGSSSGSSGKPSGASSGSSGSSSSGSSE